MACDPVSTREPIAPRLRDVDVDVDEAPLAWTVVTIEDGVRRRALIGGPDSPPPSPVPHAGGWIVGLLVAVVLLGGVVQTDFGDGAGQTPTSGDVGTVQTSGSTANAWARPTTGWRSDATSEQATRDPRFTDLTTLSFALELQVTTLRSGTQADGSLVVVNPSRHPVALTDCTVDAITSSLAPAGETPRSPIVAERQCGGIPRMVLRPDRSERIPIAQPFVARSGGPEPAIPFGGNIDPGPYEATLAVPGSTSTVSVAVPVTVLDATCAGLTDELVARYRGLAAAAAEHRATQDGHAVQVVTLDGRPQPATGSFDCGRIGLHLVEGQVVDLSLG